MNGAAQVINVIKTHPVAVIGGGVALAVVLAMSGRGGGTSRPVDQLPFATLAAQTNVKLAQIGAEQYRAKVASDTAITLGRIDQGTQTFLASVTSMMNSQKVAAQASIQSQEIDAGRFGALLNQQTAVAKISAGSMSNVLDYLNTRLSTTGRIELGKLQLGNAAAADINRTELARDTIFAKLKVALDPGYQKFQEELVRIPVEGRIEQARIEAESRESESGFDLFGTVVSGLFGLF